MIAIPCSPRVAAAASAASATGGGLQRGKGPRQASARRRFLGGLALACVALAAAPIRAEGGPDKAVRLIVPAPPASSLDVVARVLGERLEKRWKQPVRVENKAGAGGLLGMDAVAKAAPDGSVLGLGFNGPIAFGPFLYKKMPYDPAKDLLPVVLATVQPNVLAVPASNPAKTLPEYIAWARRQGDRLSYASVGNGSSSHLTAELFLRAAGLQAVHVPFNGSPPAATSVAAGETQLLFAVAPALLPLVQAGKLRLLAVTSAERLPQLQDLPTVAEQGLPGFESLAWNGVFAPAGTPAATLERLHADLDATLALPEVREALARQGLVVAGGSAAEFARRIRQDADKWGALIREAHIQLEP